jgi:hypothetical protein
MSKAIHYTDTPTEIDNASESVTSIDGLLPPPSELVRKMEEEPIK